MRRYILFFAAVGLIVAWSIFLLFISPEQLVAKIGIQNTYLVAFALAVTTGVSTLTSTSFYASIATFAAGGASPAFLAFTAGVGSFISNAIFYALFVYGKQSLSGPWRARIEYFARRVEQLPSWLIFLSVYVYAGFIPLPDDILIGALALSSYSFYRFAPFLLAGNITMILVIASLAKVGTGLF